MTEPEESDRTRRDLHRDIKGILKAPNTGILKLLFLQSLDTG